MKLLKQYNSTSQIILLFIQNTLTGQGLVGLTSGDITAYYTKDNSTTVTQISLTGATKGEYVSGGFFEIGTTMPGIYQLGLPNSIFSETTASSVAIMLFGATNMAPVPIEIQLTNFDFDKGNINSVNNPSIPTTTQAQITAIKGTTDLFVITNNRVDASIPTTTQTQITAIKGTTDLFVITNNEVNARLASTTLTSIGIPTTTQAQITAIKATTDLFVITNNRVDANIPTTTQTQLTNIKTQTDKLTFSGTDVKAYMTGTQTFNITGNVSGSVGSVTAGVALNSTTNTNLSSIKTKTDQLTFTAGDVKAYMSGLQNFDIGGDVLGSVGSVSGFDPTYIDTHISSIVVNDNGTSIDFSSQIVDVNNA